MRHECVDGRGAACRRPLACAALLLAIVIPAVYRPEAAQTGGGPTFTDVTSAAGITFRHHHGGVGRKYLPETMGSGGAFLDYDGDGAQDILLVQSTDWPSAKKGRHVLALYRNNGNGAFTDVASKVGLAVEMYGMGVAAADYDNDGDTDIYLTAVGENRLFRNTGGRFEDVTAKARVADPGFSASAMWFDADADGRLDLFVANYVEWTIETDRFCSLDGRTKSYCTPEAYKGRSPTLFRNRGDGTFDDVTKKAGMFDASNKMLGVALLDFNGDGRLDVFGANDTQPNRLYENKGNGTFADVALAAGVAYNDAGVARAGMGVDAGDYDGSGRDSLVIGNFSNEMMALYRNEGNGLFIDEAPGGTIGKASMQHLTFATFFFDADLDGRPDILAVNGHVADDIAGTQPALSHAQRPHLFRNLGTGKFEVLSDRVGRAFAQPFVGRGAAYGDYDGDGDLDLLLTENNGPARLLRNDGVTAARLRVKLTGTKSNRDAIGTRVRVHHDRGTTAWQRVKTGSSYLSQSELPLTFGLGSASAVKAIEIVWPTGRTERITGAAPGDFLTITEGKGITARTRLR